MPSLTVDEALQLGLQHHQAGRLQQAESIYRQVLTHFPDHPTALYLLGALAQQVGEHQQAEQLLGRAVARSPSVPEYHFFHAQARASLGKVDEAIAAYRQAVALRPNYADAFNNLGSCLAQQDRLDEAIAAFRQALQARPDLAEAHSNLGNALAAQGRLAEAIACQQQALRLRPDFAAAHMNLGSAYLDQGRPEEAAAACRRALQLQPGYAKAHNTLGVALLGLGRLDEAATAFHQALQLNPNFADAYSNLAIVLRERGQLGESLACCRRALELNPDLPEGHNNLGNALAEGGQLTEAAAAYRTALRLRPTYPEAENNLGTCLERQGKLDEAIVCYRAALALRPDYVAAHNNLLIALQYHERHDPDEIFAEHQRWAEQHAARLIPVAPTYPNERTPDRRLRIGYISPDFRQHPIPFFIEPILAAHDHAHYHITCYADLRRPDAVTQRLRGHADRWHDITAVADEQVAELVRGDSIDILVDLAVHAPHNRLLVLARRPAPLQVSYLGYANTTGLPAIDYRLTDEYLDPPGLTERYHTERLLRLPRTFCCYRPPDDSPPVNDLPAGRDGPITFASLNRLAKMTPAVLETWARILAAVPESRLLLQANGLEDEGTRGELLGFFRRQGIAAERLRLLGWGSFADYLRHFHEVDVGLDTFPFNGHTTTCHALWMGVPVIVLEGRTPISRVGVSLLSNLHLENLIAPTRNTYVEVAVRLAHDRERLRQLRSGLRDRLRQSPLLDAATFTRNLEAVYRNIWTEWCSQTFPSSTRSTME